MPIFFTPDSDEPKTVSLPALQQSLHPSNFESCKTRSSFTDLDPSIKKYYRAKLGSFVARDIEDRACAALRAGDRALFQQLRQEFYKRTTFWI